MKMAKRILSIALTIVTLVSVLSISAEALTVVVDDDRNYGYMVPVNSKGTKVLSTVKLYGNYDYLDFYIHSGFAGDVYFFYEIYSDKALTKCVDSGYTVCYYGDYEMTQKIKLKDKYKTKTYYAITYAAMFSSNGKKLIVDEESICQFKIKVDRSPSYDEKMVILKSVSTTTSGPKITWSKIASTSKYYIYRRSITGTKWTKVGSVSSSKTSFTDKSLKDKNGNYIYTVKGINKKGTASRYHYRGLTSLFAKTPVLSSVEVRYNNTIEVKWGKTATKAKYNVYRKADGGDWKKIGSATTTTYKDTNVKNGVKYEYTVRAELSTSYGKATSAYYSNSDKAVKYIESPYVKDLIAAENGIEVNWNLVEGSVGYYIYRKPLDKSTGWIAVGEVGADVNSFVDTTASIDNGEYFYAVRSIAETNKGSYDYVGVPYVNLATPEYTIKKQSDGYYLWCETVENANNYKLYAKNAEGEWVYQSDIWAGEYAQKLNFPQPGTREFSVVAVKECYSTISREYRCRYSDLDAGAFSWTDFPDVNPSVKLFTDKITLSWKDTGAEGYNVYKKTSLDENSQLELIASLDKGTVKYDDADVQSSVEYTYVVKGIFNGAEQTEGANPTTVTRYPAETITENVRIYYADNSLSDYDGIRVAGDIENAVFYIYNENKAIWENLSVHELNVGYGKEYVNTLWSFDSNGKIKVGVSFLRENGATAIDDYVLELERYVPQTTITQSCTKKSVKISLTPDAQALSYKLRTSYDLLDDDVVFDVSDGKKVTHTFKTTEMSEDGVGTKYGYVSFEATRADGCRTGDYVILRFVSAPTLVDAKRNSDGNPVVKWSKSQINSGGTMHIYRKAPGGDWECIKSVATSKVKTKKFSGYSSYNYYYVDKTAEAGVEYTYTVQQEATVRDVPTKSYFNTTGVKTTK